MSFGKRPAQELYDINADPDCVRNLATSEMHFSIKQRLWSQLKQELTDQNDPRILGDGNIFDFYPNCRVDRQRQLYQQPNYDPVQEFEKRFGSPLNKAAIEKNK